MNSLQKIKRVMNCPDKTGAKVLESIRVRNHFINYMLERKRVMEGIDNKVDNIFENIATQLPGDKENNISFLKDYESLMDFSTPKSAIEFNHQPCKAGCNCVEIEASKFGDKIKSYPCLEHQKEMPVWSSEKSEGFGPSPLEGLLKEFFNKSEIIIKNKDGK